MNALRRRRTWFALGAVVLALAGLWFFVDVTARRSSFCENCHYMTPYVEEWKASSHAGVDCVRCHPAQRRAMFAQAVKYWTGTYSPRPRAFVPDEACTDCHSDVFDKKGVKFLDVTFPHKPHMGVDRRGIRLHCASCHGVSEEAGHVSVDRRVCYLCHFKGQAPAETVAGCGACHGAPSGSSRHGGFLFDMKSYVESGVACNRCHLSVHEGSGGVTKDKCYSCHVSRVEKMGEAKLVHQQHVTVKEIRCLECHEPIRHGSLKMISVLDVSCESCHADLHAGPKEMYLGVGAKGAPDTPSRMFAAQINCIGCHTQVTSQGGVAFLGQGNKVADPRACAACHDARYIPMVDRWKSQGAQLAGEARRLAAEGARLAASGRGGEEAKALAKDLEFNARFLEEGHPVHNIEYAIKVVQSSGEIVRKMAEAAGASPPGIQLPLARGPFTYCLESCHGFIPKAGPISFQGVDFPHAYHVQKAALSCDTCHEAGRHTALALRGPADCTSCHHESSKADCARCHPRQSALYRGKLPASVGIRAEADSMAEAVACADCHDPTKPEPLKTVSEACVACHEKKGAQDLEAWRAKVKADRERFALLADEADLALEGMKRHGAAVDALRKKVNAAKEGAEYFRRGREVHNMAAAADFYARAAKDLEAIVRDAQAQEQAK